MEESNGTNNFSAAVAKENGAFLLSQGISLFGSQIVQMAVIWHVTLETSSGLWVTALTLAAFLPQMLMSLFGGVWADRTTEKES
jgi:DHA3 family macrolide efflux protein-like MFS transporter